jgi:hypothetical protein
MTVIALPASRKLGNVPRIASGTARQKGNEAAATDALEPVIRSVLGVVRESAGLLFHIVGLGVVLVSGTKTSRPNSAIGQTRPAAEERANVIPFPTRNVGSPTKIQQE